MKHLPTIPILLPLTIARLIGLGSASIWYDEAFTVLLARLPLAQMLRLLSLDFTPPLWELIIHPLAWGPLWLVRLPAVIFSIGAAWLAWDIAGRKSPLLFTALALLPGLLWHAQDTRSYALLSCLYLAAAWFALHARWYGLTAACGLILWTHTTGAAFVAGALALALYSHPRQWRTIVLCGALALASFLPWLPYLFNGFGTGKHWLTNFNIVWFLEQTFLAFWAGTLGGLPGLLAGLGLLTVSLGAACIRVRFAARSFVLFAVPLAVLLCVCQVQNVIVYRVLVPLLLPFSMWLVESLADTRWPRRLVTAGWVGLVAISLIGWNPSARGAGLEAAASEIRSQWRTGDQIYYATGSVAMPFYYYLDDLPAAIMDGVENTALTQPEILSRLGLPFADLPPDTARIWLIYPLEPLLTPEQTARLEIYAEGGQLISYLDYLQAADIVCFLINKTAPAK